jgi:hypothetical protein
MKPPRFEYFFLGLYLAFQLTTFAQEQTPSYPLFGIVELQPRLRLGEEIPTDPKAFISLKSYRGLYSTPSDFFTAVMKGAKQVSPNTKVIVYMGGYTAGPGQCTLVEEKYRDAIMMTDVTALSAELDEKSENFKVQTSETPLPILVSKAEISDSKDSEKYCFWIQIDSERMQVKAVNGKTGALTVQRAFHSTASSHNAGAPVFTPVYLGSNNKTPTQKARSSNGYPQSDGSIRYSLDPNSPATAQFKASFVIDWINEGYDGTWLDTFQGYGIFNHCDALGNKLTETWNFKEGKRYTDETFPEAMAAEVQGIRANVKQATGKDPYIAANNITKTYALGSKNLMKSKETNQGLDAYCFEDAFLNASTVQGDSRNFRFTPVKNWETIEENLRDASHTGRHVIAMTSAAGYVAAWFNPTYKNFQSLERYSWCSYLLTVTAEKSTSFGKPVIYNEQGFVPLAKEYTLPIGNPLEDKPIAEYKLGESDCYAREFDHAIVFVNTSEKDVTVNPKSRFPNFKSELIHLKGFDGTIVMTD